MKRVILVLISTLLVLGASHARQISVKGKTNQGSFVTAPTVKLNLSAQFSEPSGNYALDPGETGYVLVTIKNEGDAEAKSVTVRMTSNVSGILSFPSLKTIGSVAANSSTSARIDISASEQTKKQNVILTVEALDAGGVKSEAKTVTIPVEAPAPPILSVSAEFIEPSGNKLLDSGESGTVTVTVFNSGGTSAKGVAVKVALPTGSIGLSISGSVALGEIAPKASKSGTFILIASENAPTQTARLSIDVSSSDGVRVEPVSLVVNVKERFIAKDATPPEIELTEPAKITNRGLKLVSDDRIVFTTSASMMIKGIARDSGGIALVLVNGAEARLRLAAQGTEFSYEVLLALGQNDVEIKAVDKSRNESTLLLKVTREAGIVQGKYLALVIAVQDYVDKSINTLEHPIRDAESVMSVLTEQYTFDPKNVTYLRNPDRRAIFRAFDNLRRQSTDNDNLMIFYAGHGYWDEDLRQGYWLPSNSTSTDQAEWIPNSTVRDYIRGIKTKHTLLVADACFSGGIFRTREAFARPDASIQAIYNMPSRKAMTSGALKTVPDRSVFVEFLVKRLGENKERYLDAQKLYVSMKDAVINNSALNQTPLYGVINESGDEGGDFIFVRR